MSNFYEQLAYNLEFGNPLNWDTLSSMADFDFSRLYSAFDKLNIEDLKVVLTRIRSEITSTIPIRSKEVLISLEGHLKHRRKALKLEQLEETIMTKFNQLYQSKLTQINFIYG